MKKTFFLYQHFDRNLTKKKSNESHFGKVLLLTSILGVFTLTSCKKDDNKKNSNVIDQYTGLAPHTVDELKLA